MSIEKHSFDQVGGAIYAETANINYFLKTPLEPDTKGGVEVRQASVKGFSRRRYKGDTNKSNVDPTTRTYLYDPGRSNGGATPGKPFVLDDGDEKREFTFTGPFVNLHAFLLGDIAKDVTVYSPSASYKLTAVE